MESTREEEDEEEEGEIHLCCTASNFTPGRSVESRFHTCRWFEKRGPRAATCSHTYTLTYIQTYIRIYTFCPPVAICEIFRRGASPHKSSADWKNSFPFHLGLEEEPLGTRPPAPPAGDGRFCRAAAVVLWHRSFYSCFLSDCN